MEKSEQKMQAQYDHIEKLEKELQTFTENIAVVNEENTFLKVRF
jgi:hypothetical protein